MAQCWVHPFLFSSSPWSIVSMDSSLLVTETVEDNSDNDNDVGGGDGLEIRVLVQRENVEGRMGM